MCRWPSAGCCDRIVRHALSLSRRLWPRRTLLPGQPRPAFTQSHSTDRAIATDACRKAGCTGTRGCVNTHSHNCVELRASRVRYRALLGGRKRSIMRKRQRAVAADALTLYLDNLAPSGRRSTRCRLQTATEILGHEGEALESVPWTSFGYAELATVRAELLRRGKAPKHDQRHAGGTARGVADGL